MRGGLHALPCSMLPSQHTELIKPNHCDNTRFNIHPHSVQEIVDKEPIQEQEVSANMHCWLEALRVRFLQQKEETAALGPCFLFPSERCFFLPFGKLVI